VRPKFIYESARMIRNLQELYQYRSLLLALTQRELKARYRGSILGFFWTFLNPLLLMVVYTVVFTQFFKNNIEHYSYFTAVGLLPWIWFTASVAGGASTISDRRDLMTKVRFPAQVLPTAVVLTNLSNYLLSLPIILGLGLYFGVYPTRHLIVFPLVVVIQLVFTLALSFVVSALNVAFRDLQHIVANLMTLWFFGTPVLYSAETVRSHTWGNFVLHANPMAILILSYRAIFIEHRLPEMGALFGLFGASLILLWLAALIFESRREEFAELI
jgi:lipopolysaccharide transport system permease protein